MNAVVAPEALQQVAAHTPGRRRPGRRWALTLLAGTAQLGAMAVALTGGISTVLAALLAAVGVAAGGYVLLPGALSLLRRQRELAVPVLLATVVLLWVVLNLQNAGRPVEDAGAPSTPIPNPPFHIPVWGIASWPSPFNHPQYPTLALLLLAAFAGMVLVSDAVRVRLGFAPRQLAPWRQLSEVRSRAPGIAWRAVAGVALICWAAFLAIGLTRPFISSNPVLQLALLIVVASAGGLLVAIPLLVGALIRFYRNRAGDAREQERRRFAAHLHDSVLQTLALVQRQAHDPAAVARLARRQEHSLRAWMAGESELVSDTVVAGLRDVIASVEDEHAVKIELTAIGDRLLDPAAEAAVAAAREALRNAARHAAGAEVLVFAEIARAGLEIYIRDKGPGFDPAAVPAERRGIRDAIIGRMAVAGGQALVESAPGEGTEIVLRLGGVR